MARKGSKQKGKFDIKAGMVFTMPDMKHLHPNGNEIDAGIHPWLITNVMNNYIEIIMCTTITCNKEDKHRINNLSNDKTDITNPCPPMDSPKIRTSGVSLNTFFILPKKELFSHPLQIQTENTPGNNFKTNGFNSLCLNAKDLKYIQDEISEYISHNSSLIYDKFGIEEASYELEDAIADNNPDLPKIKADYEREYGWQHLKDANPYAIYPYPDQLFEWEKNDTELVKKAQKKKQEYQNRQNPNSKQTKQTPLQKAYEAYKTNLESGSNCKVMYGTIENREVIQIKTPNHEVIYCYDHTKDDTITACNKEWKAINKTKPFKTEQLTMQRLHPKETKLINSIQSYIRQFEGLPSLAQQAKKQLASNENTDLSRTTSKDDSQLDTL